MVGKLALPVLPFVGGDVIMSLVNRATGLGFPSHLTRLLQFGRVLDTGALRDRFGVTLEHSTPDTLRQHARQRRVRDLVRSQREYRYEEELEMFLRSGRLAQASSHHSKRTAHPRTTRAKRAPAAIRPATRRGRRLTGAEQ
jgi:hypothetical protein